MGVEGTCRSGNRGGCPLFYAHYIAGIPFVLCAFPFAPSSLSRAYHQGKNAPKRGKSYILFACFCVLSGNWDTERGKKQRYIWKVGAGCGAKWCRMWALWLPAVACHWCRWSGCFLMLCLRGVFPAFFPLSCFAFGALHLNMALFGFLRGFSAGFRVVVWVYIALVLCVACGAFVRVYS